MADPKIKALITEYQGEIRPDGIPEITDQTTVATVCSDGRAVLDSFNPRTDDMNKVVGQHGNFCAKATEKADPFPHLKDLQYSVDSTIGQLKGNCVTAPGQRPRVILGVVPVPFLDDAKAIGENLNQVGAYADQLCAMHIEKPKTPDGSGRPGQQKETII